MRIAQLLIVLFLSLFVIAGCQPQAQSLTTAGSDKVAVGVMLPLSGDAASYGEPTREGIELALKDTNASIDLIVEDSKCDGKEAVTAIHKLIDVDKVQAIVGELCSGATLAAGPVAMSKGVVMISPASTSPDISGLGAYVFRTIPSDAGQGIYAAKLIAQNGGKRLAILHTNDDYGVGLRDVLITEFPKTGGKVVETQALERESVDVRTQVTKIKQAQPDSIYIAGNSPDAEVAALKQLKELGVDAKLFGSEALKSVDVISSAGDAAEGLIVSSVSPGEEWFLEEYKKEYGKDAEPFAPQGYDALKAIVMALDQGATTSSEIREKLDALSFDGASGHIAFDPNGDVGGSYQSFRVEAGKFVPMADPMDAE